MFTRQSDLQEHWDLYILLSQTIRTTIIRSVPPARYYLPPLLMISSIPIPTASMFAPKPTYEEPAPTSKSADQLPPAPWDVPSPNVIPPSPSRYNQRQQFFEEQHVYGGGPANSSRGSGSYDGLAGQTQNLSIKSPPSKQETPEDAIFKDLLDFAKAKSSSPKTNRPL